MDSREKIKAQLLEIKKALYGMDEIVKVFCLSKAADLTILMLGEHAIAKSSLARVWSITTGLDFRIVTSSEVDDAMIAYIDPAIFREKNIVEMRRGELMKRDHILIDEFFLWSNKFRAKLHQLLEERTFAGLEVLTKTYTFASNPITEHYSGQVEDRNLATEDRIDLLLPMYQSDVTSTQKMMQKFNSCGRKEMGLEKVIDWNDYLVARKEIMDVKIPSDLIVWLTLFAESMSACKHSNSKFDISRARMHTLCAECNQKIHLCSKVALSKPRFLRATILLSKALAWYDNRENITEEDVFLAIKYTLPHRVIFLQEERTIFEAEKALPEILQEFIDDFNNWEQRGIFKQLETIIGKAMDPMNPSFNQEQANTLQGEVSEHLAINNYVSEALVKVQDAVKRRYKDILSKGKFATIEEMKDILEKSGLNLYDKGQILDEFISENESLSFIWEMDRRNSKAMEVLALAIRKLHQEKGDTSVKPKTRLLKSFEREISFSSDLIMIREERGRVRITASTPELRKRFEEILKELS